MKKLIITTVCAMAMSGAAFAQGWINYSLSFTSITAQTNSTVYSPLFGGGSAVNGAQGVTGGAVATGLIYDYALLYSAQAVPGVASTDTSVWDGTWLATIQNGGGLLTATNSNNAGRINPVQLSGNTQVSWANGVTNNIVLVGWSANLGSSWVGVSNILAALALGNTAPLTAQVGSANAFFGETSIGYINPNASTPGAAIVGTGAGTANGLPLFSLNTQLYLLPVPEPTSLALAGLGGLSLLLFRRQRK